MFLPILESVTRGHLPLQQRWEYRLSLCLPVWSTRFLALRGLWHVYELIYPLFWSWRMHDHMNSNARYTRSPPLSRRIFSSLLVDFLFISASHDPIDGLKILMELCIFVLLRMSSRIFHAWSTFICKSIWCFTSRGSYLLLPQASSRVKPWELKKNTHFCHLGVFETFTSWLVLAFFFHLIHFEQGILVVFVWLLKVLESYDFLPRNRKTSIVCMKIGAESGRCSIYKTACNQ